MTSRVGQGGFSDWASLRDHAIELFNGETPHPITEAEIIDAYERHPDAVARAVEAIAVDVSTGAARSGWGVLRKRAATIAAPPSNPTRATGISREKALARAEQWLHAAGCHYPDPEEVILHLCDASGILHPYAQAELVNDGPGTPARLQTHGDDDLIARIRELFEKEQPRGLAAEAEAQERADAWKQQQAARTEAITQAHAELQAQIQAKQALTVAAANEDDLPL